MRRPRSISFRRNICRPLVAGAMPGLIRIVALHTFDDGQGIRTQVFFIDNAVVADHEGLDTGDAILGRHGNQGEPSDHDSFDYIVQLSERCRGTLSLKNFEIVAVISRLFTWGVAFLDGSSYRLTDRTTWCAIFVRPVQTVTLTGSADDLLRVLIYS